MYDDEGYVEGIAESELKDGTMKMARLEGTPVLFIKQNGKLYVIDDRCPHQACSFAGGSLDRNVVICPCHDWRFNLDSGEYEENSTYVLLTYPYKIVDGKIWVKTEDF